MSAQFANGYALIIGVDQNSVDGLALPDVAKDVRAVERVFTHPERCAYPAANVKVIRGQQATRTGILGGLDWLRECLEADTGDNETAVIYYSGHGWRDDSTDPTQSYLIPYDIVESQVAFTALRATDLAGAIAALNPRRLLVVVDCCHAGAMGIKGVGGLPSGYSVAAIAPLILMGGVKSMAAPGAKGLETLSLGSGRAVLSSSTGKQRSYMRPDGKMSVFTYHLIEALVGHAEPEEGATEVLVSDVMGHVWRHVRKSAEALGVEQTPDYQVSGNFPIALLLGGKGLAKGQPAPDPIRSHQEEAGAGAGRITDTVGGAYIEGNVSVGSGDFVGRDQIVQGDQVRGDKVMGDKVHGEKVSGDDITVGDITGSTGIAIGRGSQATVHEGVRGQELASVFAPLVEAVREAPAANRAQAMRKVQALQQEVNRGGQANDERIAGLIQDLVNLVPAVAGAVTSVFADPVLGAAVGSVSRWG